MSDDDFSAFEVNRARRLLQMLLPEFRDRSEVIAHLWYDNPNANPEVRMMAIAAAVHVLLRGAPRG